MRIGVYGSGYLATVISSCLADFGMPVMGYDEDGGQITAIAQGQIPFFEKNLKEVLKRNIRSGRLTHSTDLDSFTRSNVIFLAQDSQNYIEDNALRFARMMDKEGILVIAYPVSVGTAARVEAKLDAAGFCVPVVSQPMFLTPGCAVEDFNWPDRILLGTTKPHSIMTLKHIYRPLVMRGVPVIVTNHETAELAREAATAFLATKVSFINELAGLCEHVNADAVDLAMAMGLDKKISPRCFQPGIGFGGNFVESDLDSLAQLASGNGVSLKIISAAREVNRTNSDRIADKISRALETVAGKEVGILGLSLKPNTNLVAGSSSILIARRLLSKGAHVRAYDPVAIPDARTELDGAVRYCETAYDAADGSEALVVGTGWPEFRALDFERIKKLLKRPIIVDTKNVLDSVRMRSMGFQYVGVGRPN